MSEYGASLQSNIMELVKCKLLLYTHFFTYIQSSLLFFSHFYCYWHVSYAITVKIRVSSNSTLELSSLRR